MKRPWNVVGAGFNDDGVYFTFDDTTIHRDDVRLMEAAPDLLEALQAMLNKAYKQKLNDHYPDEVSKALSAISKALGGE
nr:MAG TPA: F-ACTIN-CAPPING PROTEIN SUBUNIT ALPHA, F-ACTIN-CAPPING-BINDING PROTEIN.2A [Caudoviricetes sp.]